MRYIPKFGLLEKNYMMKIFTVNRSKEDVERKVLSAASRLDLVVKTKSPDVINLRHEGSMLSFGNDIKVKLTSKGAHTKVMISSKSSSPLQIIDWNTNRRLEDDLKKILRSLL